MVSLADLAALLADSEKDLDAMVPENSIPIQ